MDERSGCRECGSRGSLRVLARGIARARRRRMRRACLRRREAVDRCPKPGCICCAAATARSTRAGRWISSAGLRATEPGQPAATRPVDFPSRLSLRCRCLTARLLAARRRVSSAYRGRRSSRSSAPLRSRERLASDQTPRPHNAGAVDHPSAGSSVRSAVLLGSIMSFRARWGVMMTGQLTSSRARPTSRGRDMLRRCVSAMEHSERSGSGLKLRGGDRIATPDEALASRRAFQQGRQ